MTGFRRARQPDANRAALHEGWLKLGGSWLDLVPETGGEPDALVGWRGQDRLVEIKNPLGSACKRRPRPNQLAWHRAWKGRRPAVVETLAELVRLFDPPILVAIVPANKDARHDAREKMEQRQMANATEKRVSKLEAKTERQEATITRLRDKIADMKAKRAATRSAKAASPRAAAPRTAPAKRRKSTRSTQASASA